MAIATSDRRCAYEHCSKSIAHKRKNALYCDSTCRAEATHLRKGRRADPAKALPSAARPARRPTRDGSGVRLYVVADEVREMAVADQLSGSLRAKAAKAAQRLAR